ncbi:MAG: Rrf2 family transcriptional regulator [Planctomycetota bacterium]
MILPNTTIYAMRALSVLANLAPGESIRAPELAEAADVPTYYVSKVMRRLVVAGLVDSQKGHHGGFKLARAPERISFEAILRATDVELEAGRCVFHFTACDARKPCPLHDTWSQLQDALGRWARDTTLATARGKSKPR